MGKFSNLIFSLPVKSSYEETYERLVKADVRVVQFLCRELLNNPDPFIRETCAEILRDRRNARAVPALIQALKDDSLYVRQDALWAIGHICRFEPGGLEWNLSVTNIDPPNKLYTKLNKWWRVNRQFIERSLLW